MEPDETSAPPKKIVKYVRPNDRTPEKDFEKLAISDKIRICETRTAVGAQRSRISKLKDDIEDKEKIIDQERSLRIAAEERLKTQVEDLYKNPEVNEELRQRLPKANKTDPFYKISEEEKDSKVGEESGEEMLVGGDDSLDAEISAIAESVENKTPQKMRKSSRKCLKFEKSEVKKAATTDTRAKTPDNMPSHQFHSPHSVGTPYSYSFCPPMAQSTPLPNVNQKNVIESAANNSCSDSGMGRSLPDIGNSMSSEFFSRLYTNGTNYNSMGASSIFPQSSSHMLTSPLTASGHNKQVTLLLAEIDFLKEKNEKLSNEIREKDIQLEAALSSLQLQESELKRNELSQAAALVEEIHAAQKKSEESMMKQVDIANQARDDAIERWREAQAELDRYCKSNTEESFDDISDLDEMLNHYLDSSRNKTCSDIDDRTQMIVNFLECQITSQKDITAEEIQIILDQRNTARSQCKKLQQSVFKLNNTQVDSNKEKNLKCKLRAVEQERDIAVSKMKQLQDENQNLTLYYSLHKSLSPDVIARDRENNTFNVHDSEMKVQTRRGNDMQMNNLDQVKILQEKNEALERDVEKAQNKIFRLERHVNVLQRKLTSPKLGEQ